MGESNTNHRTLVSGIQIKGAVPVGLANVPGVHGTGTLTGLATRNSDNKRVLVTNAHVLVGLTAGGGYRNPTSTKDENMHQGKAGGMTRWATSLTESSSCGVRARTSPPTQPSAT